MVRSLALVMLCSTAAFAAPTASATLKDPLVEVAWTEGGQQRARFAVVLPADKACSNMELDQVAWEVKLQVCRNGGEVDAPLLELTIERVDRMPATATHERTSASMKLRSSVVLRRGATMPIGSFQPIDKAHEVTASLR